MGKHYVFSDIHGIYELFRKIKDFLMPDDICYVLGDCADRGDGGINIIKEVLADKRFIYLKGNHDDMFVKTVLYKDEVCREKWLLDGNGGKTTLEQFKKDGSPIEIIKLIDNLPLTATYTNEKGTKYLMSHAGFSYNKPENERDYLWDRSHCEEIDNNIPKNTIILHGHTPQKYLYENVGIKGELLECKNTGEKAVFVYNNGQKINIDCGTFRNKFIALYCLDTGEVYKFNE